MKLSTRARYGLRALVDLTLHDSGKPVQLKDIAERQDLSQSYLEHLIIPLISTGVLKSMRGSKGGIMLARKPENISLKEILEVLEGPLTPVDCLKPGNDCSRSDSCAARDVWQQMQYAMEEVLSSQSLKDIAERQKKR